MKKLVVAMILSSALSACDNQESGLSVIDYIKKPQELDKAVGWCSSNPTKLESEKCVNAYAASNLSTHEFAPFAKCFDSFSSENRRADISCVDKVAKKRNME